MTILCWFLPWKWMLLSCVTMLQPHGLYLIIQVRILEWVAVPFCSRSSWPSDRTWVSHIAGGFFTSWATREAQTPAWISPKYTPVPFPLDFPPSSRPPHPSRLLQSPGLSSRVVRQIPTGDLFYMWWCVCFHATLSTHSTLSFLPVPCVCKSVPCLHLHCCPAIKFISAIFIDSIYALIDSICFSLSDLLHAVY